MRLQRSMKLLFITLEFATGTFSGNGVYAQSQVCWQALAISHIMLAHCCRHRHIQRAAWPHADQQCDLCL